MKRPVGVTVIAVVNICGAVILPMVKSLVPTGRMHGAILGIVIGQAAFSLIVIVGLLRLKSWARILTILSCWLNLLLILGSIIRAVLARQWIEASGAGLGGLFVGWMLWYLSEPDIIAAFRLRENLDWRENLNIRYRTIPAEGTTAVADSSVRSKPGSRWVALRVGSAVLCVGSVVAIAAVIWYHVGRGINANVAHSKVTIGTSDEVYYFNPITANEAKALGEALRANNYFQDKGFSVALSRDGSEAMVTFIVNDHAFGSTRCYSLV